MFDCVGELFFNAFAMCVGEVNVFSLKIYLLANQCIVFQRVCVLCL